MAKMDENFAFLILLIVAEIPSGKVATYGQIAELAGYPKNARLVGRVLHQADFYGSYPCHRVVNSQGMCASSWPQQPNLLAGEGVGFKSNRQVDLKQYQWQGDL